MHQECEVRMQEMHDEFLKSGTNASETKEFMSCA